MSSAQEAMDTIGAALQRELVTCLAEVSASFSFDFDLKNQVLGSVNNTGRIIEELVTTKRAQVLAGTRTFENWSSLAKTCHDSLEYYADSIGEWSFGGIVAATIEQSATDVKQDAKDTLDATTPTLVLVLLIVIGIIVLRVL